MSKYKYSLLLLILMFSFSCTSDSDENGDDGISGIDKTANLQGLGDSASHLLSDSEFTSMNIEIVYVNGFAPTEAALANFKSFLEERTFKPDGINISLRAVSSSGKAPFSIEEIVEIEKDTRTVYNAGDEIAVYIYFADGKSEKDEENKFTLGSAFRNTSMVIFGGTIEDFASRPNAPTESDIEAAVLNHEFGHLFGLVDIGTEPQSDHKDDDNEGHCNVPDCLMRASIEFGSGIIDEIEGGRVPQLGMHCIRDLQAAGGR
ncbi:hypothetical protein APR41_12185 [Salegentibacter salinarum]|uniref:Membrane metalloprotease n=1 Tax=Salegentibacter salinarum TaxID=447422 RepID=A0A2N0U2E5_9FLAO|nr:hypothetical protein [Salegentibacter salinarum]PKD21167.1 hypothetical protein APR41_12185 [Salegentibacter salinarum]SKB76651.1 hypothetical protein SAMN05660903_02484 [Salegentibacter salinarum]